MLLFFCKDVLQKAVIFTSRHVQMWWVIQDPSYMLFTPLHALYQFFWPTATYRRVLTRRGVLSHHKSPEAQTGNKNHYGPGKSPRRMFFKWNFDGNVMAWGYIATCSIWVLLPLSIGSLLNMTCIYWQGSWELSLAIEKSWCPFKFLTEHPTAWQ